MPGVIINTDAKNEADDQFAIVHALLSPSLQVEGIIPAHFGDRRSAHSLEESREEVDLVLRLLGMSERIVVANGAATALPDEDTPMDSPGARLIIHAARRPGRLFLIFLGPLTDMASALLLDPALRHNRDLTVVWIGGSPYDGVHGDEPAGEFNLSNDVAAANVVMRSGVAVWQIPWSVYTMVSVGYAELDARVAPFGKLGEYLVRQLKDFNASFADVEEMEYRSLGDSPAVGVVLNPRGAVWRLHPVRIFDEHARLSGVVVPGRTVQVADSVDVRWLLEDMFAKIQRFASLGAEA
ncbi:nucleoside hydrolase [Tessaracoccus defluvii]|uniref:Nucleoside hydrolase n=1 Tax=Tessaracoccus defluvii TaxID=1285901 RepID=A0A7H0H4I4_9ACTN|nr:nucleoside hydrolase [Tessaracoccus defluvii]